MARPQINICGKITMIAFIILNIFFLLVGLALVGGGSYLVHTGSNLDFFTGSRYFSGAAIIIAAGIVTFFITIAGILGAIFLSKCLLGIYLVAVVLIVVLEVVAGILGFVYRDQVTDQASNIAQDALNEYFPEGDSRHKTATNAAIDEIQRDFKCCGWVEPNDWNATEYFNITMSFPGSCNCTDTNDPKVPCEPTEDGQQTIYMRGCRDGVVDFFRDNLVAAGGIGIAFGLLEILAVLMAVGLCCCIVGAKDQYTTV